MLRRTRLTSTIRDRALRVLREPIPRVAGVRPVAAAQAKVEPAVVGGLSPPLLACFVPVELLVRGAQVEQADCASREGLLAVRAERGLVREGGHVGLGGRDLLSVFDAGAGMMGDALWWTRHLERAETVEMEKVRLTLSQKLHRT